VNTARSVCKSLKETLEVTTEISGGIVVIGLGSTGVVDLVSESHYFRIREVEEAVTRSREA
jgi:hypothetical protein